MKILIFISLQNIEDKNTWFMGCGQLGSTELIIISFVILLLFGSKKLPALAKSIGAGITEFKKGLSKGFNEEEEEDIQQEQSKTDTSKKKSHKN